MAVDAAKARQQLSQIRILLRQGKMMPAVLAVQSAAQILGRGQFLKEERREFERLLEEATTCLTNDEKLHQIYPLQIVYKPGREQELYETLKDICETLDEIAVENAKEEARLREERKRSLLARCKEEFSRGEMEAGLKTLALLKAEFPHDPQLRGEIGKILINAGLYAEAVDYLQQALELDPELVPLYNLIGIALRKLDRFEHAEQYYLQASAHMRMNPTLYYNIARMYLDWKKWDKAIKAARVALHLRADFPEAQQLLEYTKTRRNAEAAEGEAPPQTDDAPPEAGL